MSGLADLKSAAIQEADDEGGWFKDFFGSNLMVIKDLIDSALNMGLDKEDQFYTGNTEEIIDGINSMFSEGEGHSQANAFVAEHIGQSISVSLGREVDTDAITNAVEFALQAGARFQGEEYIKLVREELQGIEVDPKAFFRGMKMAQKEYSSFVRKNKDLEQTGIDQDNVMIYAMSRAIKNSGLNQAVSAGPDIQNSQDLQRRADSLMAAEGRDGLELIEDPTSELNPLFEILDSIDEYDETDKEAAREELLMERGLRDSGRGANRALDDRERESRVKALENLISNSEEQGFFD